MQLTFSLPGCYNILNKFPVQQECLKEVSSMKKGCSLLLALIICLSGIMVSSVLAAADASTSASSGGSFVSPSTSLSPRIKCPVQPTFYCKPRFYDTETQKANNMSKGLSAKQINSAPANRKYGLFFKFTPSRSADGYQISRFDWVYSDKNGHVLYTDSLDASTTCRAGYSYSWKFFPLEGFYENLRAIYGEVVPGRFVLDIYFNGLWAGKTNINIGK